jgi:urease accessory protein
VSIVLSQQLTTDRQSSSTPTPTLTLWLTAEERTRTRHRFLTEDATPIFLRLPRGTILHNGDVLASDDGKTLVQIAAKPEPVITIVSDHPIDLLRAAYHLGNRHVTLEITPSYLRLTPDPVLEEMIAHLGLTPIREVAPFVPESGAYTHHH